MQSPMASEPQPHMRVCDRSGCLAGGDFRAPRSRASLDAFFWFCLEHVREYNAAWNYYAGMSEAEIEAEVRNDTVWQRPTWPLGSRFSALHGPHIRDDFGVTGEDGADGPAERKNERRRPLSATEEALTIFEIAPPFTIVRLKARYKELVKLHHPDANGGDKECEERLKTINQAYALLKASYFS
jgi:hypothetical protein